MKNVGLMIIIVTICLMLSACSLKTAPNNENQIMQRVSNPESTKILFTENYHDGSIILYQDETGFRASYYKQKDDYWVGGGNADLNPEDGFTWIMSNDPNIDMVLFAGVITDDNIEEVIVKQKTLEKNAKIIDVNNEKRIWFTTFEILEQDKNGPDPLKIEAFDKEGKIYWKDGIYKEGSFRGKTNR